jgi:hypothetical protein
MYRRILFGLGVLLILFHGWLLAGQAWAGQLNDIALVTRWLVAGGLLLGLRQLRRQGASMFWGRKAVALWLLAALLHGPALAQRLAVDAPALPEVVATIAPITAGAIAIAGLLSLVLAAGVRRRDRHTSLPSLAFVFVIAGALSPDRRWRYAPRPPPLS